MLVAQVRAILRRVGADTGRKEISVRELGNTFVNPAGREVLVNSRRVELRTKEFDLLLALVDHAYMVLSRDQLLPCD